MDGMDRNTHQSAIRGRFNAELSAGLDAAAADAR